jgi:hypothetical protein
MLRKLIGLVLGLALAASAQAVCYKDGRPYQTGDVVGGYVCQPDGSWKKQ